MAKTKLIEVLKNSPRLSKDHCENCVQNRGSYCLSGVCIDYSEWERLILSAVSELLPKDKTASEYPTPHPDYIENRGWNKAIAEMRVRLLGKKEDV